MKDGYHDNAKSSSKYKRLSEAQRMEIVQRFKEETCPSNRELARQYNVTEGAIRRIKHQRDEIESRVSIMPEAKRKKTFRKSVGYFLAIEEKLLLWILTMRIARLAVTPSLIIKRAKQFADTLKIFNFKASWGWLKGFCDRRGLKETLLFGEVSEVDRNDPELLQSLSKLERKLAAYPLDRVYSMDEAGLFFRQLPQHTVLMPNEEVKTIQGRKYMKERVSIVVCTNATGRHKITCSMIGQSKNPVCIENKQWPIPYYYQKKAWMDRAVFVKWFQEVFKKEVRERTNGKVVLLLDNCPGHETMGDKDVEILCFPPSCTSWKQPCNQGIIATLKKRAKASYLRDVLNFYDQPKERQDELCSLSQQIRKGGAGVQFGNPAHLLDVTKYVIEAWKNVSSASIRNCWRKAELFHDRIVTTDNDIIASDAANASLDESISDLVRRFNELNFPITLRDVLDCIDDDDRTNPNYVACVLEDVEEVVGGCPGQEGANDGSVEDNKDCPGQGANVANDGPAENNKGCPGQEGANDGSAEDNKERNESLSLNNENTNTESLAAFWYVSQLYGESALFENKLMLDNFKEAAGASYDAMLQDYLNFRFKLRALALELQQKLEGAEESVANT